MRSLAGFSALLAAVVLSSCSPPDPRAPVAQAFPALHSHPALVSSGQNPVGIPVKSRASLLRELNLRRDFIPKGRHGRKVRRYMKPRYITIHSTQNYDAGALQHALALKNGKLRSRKVRGGNRTGYLTWHYTVDDHYAIQHLPNTEQGEHADFNGPGNNYSIGIEMCEHRGSDLNETIERTAILTAKLMIDYDIKINNIVPHYHWPRRGKNPAHKNCPHFLLNHGRPGRKWRWFQSKVQYYHSILTQG